MMINYNQINSNQNHKISYERKVLTNNLKN